MHVCVNKPQRFVSLSLPRSTLLHFCSIFHTFSFAAVARTAAGKASSGSWTDRKLKFSRVNSVPVLLPELGSLHSWTRNSAGRLGWGMHDQRGSRVASALIYFKAPPVRCNCSLAHWMVWLNIKWSLYLLNENCRTDFSSLIFLVDTSFCMLLVLYKSDFT